VAAQCIFRYNPLLTGLFPVNNNPQIRWLGVYRVTGNDVTGFSPESDRFDGRYELIYLYNEYDPASVVDTLVIDDGYTYYLAGDRGINAYTDSAGTTMYDTTIDFVTWDLGDTVLVVKETYEYQWFYQNVDEGSSNPDSLLYLDDMDAWPSLTLLQPPLVTSMRRFRVWLVVYDDWEDETNSARGYAMRAVDGVFSYTSAYENSVKR